MYIYGIVSFDANDLFILGAGFLVLSAAAFLPTRFTPSQTVYLLVFNFWLAVVVDQTLAVPPYDLYDIMDSPRMDVMDLFIYVVIYPASGYLFCYTASSIGFHRKAILGLLVLGWSGLTLGLEWASLQFGVFTYRMWGLGYSVISYLIIHVLQLLVLWYVAGGMKDGHLKKKRDVQ